MSNTLQQLETMRSMLSDFMDNAEIQASIRGSAYGFSIEVKKAIQQLKCPHRDIAYNTFKLHNDDYVSTVCCNCKKELKQERGNKLIVNTLAK